MPGTKWWTKKQAVPGRFIIIDQSWDSFSKRILFLMERQGNKEKSEVKSACTEVEAETCRYMFIICYNFVFKLTLWQIEQNVLQESICSVLLFYSNNQRWSIIDFSQKKSALSSLHKDDSLVPRNLFRPQSSKDYPFGLLELWRLGVYLRSALS